MTDVILLSAAGVLGLIFGSFANVCVHRFPRGISVVTPGSRCPSCEHAIAWFDNIPLLSYLLLHGRCRYCQKKISIRYPLLELLMGLSWLGLAWHYGLTMELALALALVSMLWILTLIDLEKGLLPDILTLPGIVIGCMFGLWFGHFIDSIIGAVAGYGFFWLVARLFLLATGREGMGYGDFKLLAMLGAFLGWQALPFVVFMASLTGALIGGICLILSHRHVRTEIPFGPWLALAGVLWMLWGPEWIHAYLVWVT